MSNIANKGSIATAVMLFVGILIFVVALVFTLHNPNPQVTERRQNTTVNSKNKIEEEQVGDDDFYNELKELALSFVGYPHLFNPTDEDNLYTEEGFDDISFILSVVAKGHDPQNPEDLIKEINYYPSQAVSILNRTHFATYRNKVSPYFTDITEEIGGDVVKEKTITLNKMREDSTRLVDISWEEDVIIQYIEREDVSDVIDRLPAVAGVMFLYHEDEEIGLDVRLEGLVIENTDIIYSSVTAGEVVKRDLIEYIENNDFDGILFYIINKL